MLQATLRRVQFHVVNASVHCKVRMLPETQNEGDRRSNAV